MIKRALEITAGFEGSNYGTFAGNFDGMGISVGILQWNLGTGTLQKLVKRYQGNLDSHFPKPIKAVMELSNDIAVKYAADNMQTPEWKTAWQKFMQLPEMVSIQCDAASPYADTAARLQKKWGLNTLRSFCFFFDVAVQNGSMKIVEPKTPTLDQFKVFIGRGDPRNKEIWSKISPTVEQMTLVQAAWERAALATPKWRNDVFTRKASIAMGVGIVHGKMFIFQPVGPEPAAT